MKAGLSYLVGLFAAAAVSFCAGAMLEGWIATGRPRQAPAQAGAEAPRIMRVVLASGSFSKAAGIVASREIPPRPERRRPAPLPADPDELAASAGQAGAAAPDGPDARETARPPALPAGPGGNPAGEAPTPNAWPAAAAPAERRLSPPMPLGEVRPAYPMSARRRGLEGAARVRVVVGADGAPLTAEIVSSSGHGTLDQAALSAVMAAAYRPAESDGRNIQGELLVPVRFVLVER